MRIFARIVLSLLSNQKNKIMKILLLVKHIEKKFIMSMYFENEEQVINWWSNLPNPDEWIIVHEGKRKEHGHRYELMYTKFDEQGKLYSKYIFCFSKKEAVLLTRKIKEANSSYTINVRKLY